MSGEAERAQLATLITVAAQLLPAHHREVLKLRFEEDLEIPVIAKYQKVSREAAKSRVRYAIQALRETVG